MAVAKIYNSQTGQWEAVIVGATGETGPAGSDGALSPNYIINGAFDFWQRGDITSQTTNQYTSDRWYVRDFGQSWTVTEQVSGLTGFDKCARVQRDSGNTAASSFFLSQPIETTNALSLAGQDAVLSFYARKGADFSPTDDLLSVGLRTTTADDENPIAGGTDVVVISLGSATLTDSWQRFTFTGSIGDTARSLSVDFNMVTTGTAGANDYYEITGVQLEAGSIATPFKRNANSIAGELAACQRYYLAFNGNNNSARGFGWTQSTTELRAIIPTPVTMRATPTISLDDGGIYAGGNFSSLGTISEQALVGNGVQFNAVVSGVNNFEAATVRADNTSYLDAELK